MEEARDCALKGQVCQVKLDMHRWILDFEVNTGVPLKEFKENYLLKALNLAKHKGIPVEGSGEQMKITGFKYKAQMPFDEAALNEGRPIIGGFEHDRNFGCLQGKNIYQFDSKTFDYSGGKRPGHHVVLFIGYGVKDRMAYLVLLNSWGVRFCQNGIGRIRFTDVRDFFTITR